MIGSKNVPAPGPGASAYSASKAALNQLARIAALEWGADGIRINTLHPNAVFDTGLWTEDVLAQRARQYGMTVEAYPVHADPGQGVAHLFQLERLDDGHHDFHGRRPLVE